MDSRTVDNCPDKASATTNYVYVAPSDPLAAAQFVEIGPFVFNVGPHAAVSPGALALNSVQRRILRVSARDAVPLAVYAPPSSLPVAAVIYGEVAPVAEVSPAAAAAAASGRGAAGPSREFAAPDVVDRLLKDLSGQVLTAGQQVVFELQGVNLRLVVGSITAEGGGADGGAGGAGAGQQPPPQPQQHHEVRRAAVAPGGATAFIFTNSNAHAVRITGQKGIATTAIFKHRQLNFESLGIGGLDRQFEAIFRRAFASRVFPPAVLERLGIHHVKGLLLYGPPGTGKTLIARQIGKMLNGREPKVVNGPEVLSKYVGQAEENVRALFADAEAEYREKGDQSELHIVIFDEIDAICKQRGSVRDGTATHDTIVNQLLTKIDGVDALNNILLIGMTNRRDMLDEAMLRPGRLEVQIEIGLPDEPGRGQILRIHTGRMAAASFLSPDVDLASLATRTKNFSGAELEGLVKSAASFALNRNVDINDLHKPLDEESIRVTAADFEAALAEVSPAFGAASESLKGCAPHGLIPYGAPFSHLADTLRALVRQVATSDKTPLLSVLLEGPPGSGKSALAATAALQSGFPFAKVISPEQLVGYGEQAKCSAIAKTFDDACKSPLSVVILDDVERLLEYVPVGPRFSNAVLQTLTVLVKRPPPEGRRLLVIATTPSSSAAAAASGSDVLGGMGLADAFNVALHVPALSPEGSARVLESVGAFPAGQGAREAAEALAESVGEAVPVKRLLLWVEMARQEAVEGLAGGGGGLAGAAGRGGGGDSATADGYGGTSAAAGHIPIGVWRKVLRDLA